MLDYAHTHDRERRTAPSISGSIIGDAIYTGLQGGTPCSLNGTPPSAHFFTLADMLAFGVWRKYNAEIISFTGTAILRARRNIVTFHNHPGR